MIGVQQHFACAMSLDNFCCSLHNWQNDKSPINTMLKIANPECLYELIAVEWDELEDQNNIDKSMIL